MCTGDAEGGEWSVNCVLHTLYLPYIHFAWWKHSKWGGTSARPGLVFIREASHQPLLSLLSTPTAATPKFPGMRAWAGVVASDTPTRAITLFACPQGDLTSLRVPHSCPVSHLSWRPSPPRRPGNCPSVSCPPSRAGHQHHALLLSP
jgi:hypothetical protein